MSLVGDGGAYFLANGGGLDDIVAAVDFCEMLAFDAGFRGLAVQSAVIFIEASEHWGKGLEGEVKMSKTKTYRVTSAELLLGTDHSTTSRSSVQSTLPTDDGLPRNTASAGLASNLGNGIPIV